MINTSGSGAGTTTASERQQPHQQIMIAADMTNLRKATEAALSGFAQSNKQTLNTEELKAPLNGSDTQ